MAQPMHYLDLISHNFSYSTRKRSWWQARSSLLPAGHGLITFWTQEINLTNSSLSSNTLKAYPTGWKTYRRFMTLYPCSYPKDIRYVMAFAAYCDSELVLSGNTIKLYLSGVQHFRSLQTPDSRSIFAAHSLKAMLKSIRRLSTSTIHRTDFLWYFRFIVSFPFWHRSQFSAQGSHLPEFFGLPQTQANVSG